MFGRLGKTVAKEVDRLSEAGNAEAAAGHYDDAIKLFWQAFDLLPDPKEQRPETTWLIASIGDMLFHKKEYAKARDAFEDAVRCPNGLGNAFIHLRLGEIYFELGDERRAADELTRAYMASGRDAFKAEDLKYFSLLERVLRPPPGHDKLP